MSKISTEILPPKRTLPSRPSVPIYLLHRVQERIRTPANRRRLATMISWLRPKASQHAQPDISVLERNGIMMFPAYLSSEQAATLREIIAAMNCRDPWKLERGSFSLAEAPEGTHVADVAEAPMLKAAQDIAFDERLLSIAAAYFGSVPYVDSIQAWWSLSGNDEPEEAENFHRDNDGVRFLKFFLYLTDVEDEQGPHRFVRGSHADPLLLARRRYTDEEVEAAFGADRILTMRGQAGDAFIEDTFGMHKGQLPISGNRLLLQVRYSITPTIFRSRLTVDAPPPKRDCASISLIHEG